MSGVTTPTLPDSLEDVTGASSASPREQSSPPTSPGTRSDPEDAKMDDGQDDQPKTASGDLRKADDNDDEDTEGMDMKARALTKLLQTSSVSLNVTFVVTTFNYFAWVRFSWQSCPIR